MSGWVQSEVSAGKRTFSGLRSRWTIGGCSSCSLWTVRASATTSRAASCGGRGLPRAGPQAIPQAAPRAVGHRVGELAIDLAHQRDRDDADALGGEVPGQVDLVLESPEVDGVAPPFGIDLLKHLPAAVGILDEEQPAHAPAGQLAEESIALGQGPAAGTACSSRSDGCRQLGLPRPAAPGSPSGSSRSSGKRSKYRAIATASPGRDAARIPP